LRASNRPVGTIGIGSNAKWAAAIYRRQRRVISSVPTATSSTPPTRPGCESDLRNPKPSQPVRQDRDRQLTGDQQRHDTRDAQRPHATTPAPVTPPLAYRI